MSTGAAAEERVVVSTFVALRPSAAFDVFTREIHLWWRPNPLFEFTRRQDATLAFEPGAGGRFVETAADGSVFEIGRITCWEPGRRLGFTWRQADFEPGQSTEVEVRFDAVGDETRVTVVHHGWDSVPQASVVRHGMADALFLQRHGQWWQALLAGLRRRIAG